MTKLCDQIGISFHPNMLNFSSAPQTGFGYKDQSTESLGDALVSSKANLNINKLKDPQVWRFASDYLSLLDNEVLREMGYSAEEMNCLLRTVRPSRLSLLRTVSLDYLIQGDAYTKSRKRLKIHKLLKLLKA